jgi:hypothetical protein
MTRTTGWIVLTLMTLGACAGDGSSQEAAPSRESASQASEHGSGGTAVAFTRQSFVLCPALEDHREELASIVGFEQDPERGLSVMSSECIVHGKDFAFARVTLLPAMVPSIAMHVESFDTEASPAPELGEDAMFVDGALQPHVVFSIGGLFLDVDAENVETPSRETMIELALRIRDILTEANS